MKVCIVGGGHIGTTLLCYIKHTCPEHIVSLFTRHPERFRDSIICNDVEGGFSYSIRPDCVSGDPEKAAGNADIVYVALPHFAVKDAFKDFAPYVSDNAFVGVLPGGAVVSFSLMTSLTKRKPFSDFKGFLLSLESADMARKLISIAGNPLVWWEHFIETDLTRHARGLSPVG